MPTARERASDALLHTAVDMAADREQLSRSISAARSDQHSYERAQGILLTARWVDSLLLWLSARLRPKRTLR